MDFPFSLSPEPGEAQNPQGHRVLTSEEPLLRLGLWLGPSPSGLLSHVSSVRGNIPMEPLPVTQHFSNFIYLSDWSECSVTLRLRSFFIF